MFEENIRVYHAHWQLAHISAPPAYYKQHIPTHVLILVSVLKPLRI